jgi:hypothetical protein
VARQPASNQKVFLFPPSGGANPLPHFVEDRSFMRTTKYLLALSFALGLIANVFATRADDDSKPKHTTKEIMTLAHKQGLFKKIAAGNGTDEDKKQLAELYAELVKNTPEKGTPESWKEKSEAIAFAAKDVAAGKPDALATLKKANNCGACHKAHK